MLGPVDCVQPEIVAAVRGTSQFRGDAEVLVAICWLVQHLSTLRQDIGKVPPVR